MSTRLELIRIAVASSLGNLEDAYADRAWLLQEHDLLRRVLFEVARLWPSVKDAPADVVLARCEAISASVATVLYQIHEETADRTESADSGPSPPPTTRNVAGITAVTGGERPACSRCGGTLGCGALCITTDVPSECGSEPSP